MGTRNDRKLKNLFVTRRFQMKLSILYILSGVGVIAVMNFFIYQRLMIVQDIMNNNTQFEFSMMRQMNDIMFEIVQVSLGGFTVFMIISFVFALLVSHRIAGPVVAIKATIYELTAGNYDYRRNLRPHDELTDVMDDLHKLTDALATKIKGK